METEFAKAQKHLNDHREALEQKLKELEETLQSALDRQAMPGLTPTGQEGKDAIARLKREIVRTQGLIAQNQTDQKRARRLETRLTR